MTFEDALIRLKLPDGTPAELRLRGQRFHRKADERGKVTGPHLELPETWLEYRLRGGWTAALRILPDADGQLVVGEVRVFYIEPAGSGHDAGRWEPRVDRGPTAIGLPPGGLPARVLREVRIPSSLHAIRGLMREFQEGWKKLGVDPFERNVLFGSQGFTEDAAEEPPRTGPGRPALEERELARLARDYVRLIDRGVSAPVPQLARAYAVAPSTIHDRLGKARSRELLTASPIGRAGGRLTPRAEELVKRRKRG